MCDTGRHTSMDHQMAQEQETKNEDQRHFRSLESTITIMTLVYRLPIALQTYILGKCVEAIM